MPQPCYDGKTGERDGFGDLIVIVGYEVQFAPPASDEQHDVELLFTGNELCKRIEQCRHGRDALDGDIENGALKPKATSLQNRRSISAPIALPFADTENPKRWPTPRHCFVTDKEPFLLEPLQRGLTLLLAEPFMPI